jgi:hypothetical protein
MKKTLLYGAHVIETELRPSGYALIINGKESLRRFTTLEKAERFGMNEIDRLLERNRKR